MTTSLKLRRGTTSQHATFTGAEGEVTVDTTKDTVVVHDGATAGGFPLAKEKFLQTGTSAVARTVDGKLKDFVSVKDFGAVGDDSTNDTSAIQAAIATGKKLYFPKGIYRCNVTLSASFHWEGDGNRETVLKPYSTSTPVVKNLYQDPDWKFTTISGIGFESTGSQVGVGFSFGDPAGYTTGQELVGRVVFNDVVFKNFDKGVFKCFGNIGNVFNNCSFQFNNYGYYARGAQFADPTSGLMHAGCDTFNGGEIHENYKAGVCVLDNSGGTGQWTFNQTIFEFNQGFGAFFDFGVGNAWFPIVFNNVWDEGNGRAYPGLSTTTVSIDTLTGAQTLAPKGKSIRGMRDFQIWGENGMSNGIGTAAPNAPLGIWGNQRTALNLIGGGYGADWTRLSFASEGTEGTPGAYIYSIKSSGTDRSLAFFTGSGTYVPVAMEANGSVKIGTDAVGYASPAAGCHTIYGPNIAGGSTILTIGGRFAANASFQVADNGGANAASSAFVIQKVNATGRSINAAGTVNASGADYAEYMVKRGGCGSIAKGQVCGVDSEGKLTDQFALAHSFVVKSTDPSYVGGDVWGDESVIGVKPIEPVQRGDELNEDMTEIVNPAETDEAFAIRMAAYEAELAPWKERLEAEREKVDRIAFAGQVPCIVSGSFGVGDYIIAQAKEDGSIEAVAVSSPSFEQYQLAVGKVWAVKDSKAWIAVKIA